VTGKILLHEIVPAHNAIEVAILILYSLAGQNDLYDIEIKVDLFICLCLSLKLAKKPIKLKD
jgi:hypothetical protein